MKILGERIELQFKSDYSERVAHCGSAAHDKREGKKRNLPIIDRNKFNFTKNIASIIPEYKVVRDERTLYKCSELENVLHFYQEEINKLQSSEEKMQFVNTLLNLEEYRDCFGENVCY